MLFLRNPINREILDEDVRINREVFEREKKQVQVFGESIRPPNKIERRIAFELEKYFNRLKTSFDKLYTEALNFRDGDPKLDFSDAISFYNELVSYVKAYANSQEGLSQRDLLFLRERFDSLMPIIEGLLGALSEKETTPRNLNALEDIYNNLITYDYTDPISFATERFQRDDMPLRGQQQLQQLANVMARSSAVDMNRRPVLVNPADVSSVSVAAEVPSFQGVPIDAATASAADLAEEYAIRQREREEREGEDEDEYDQGNAAAAENIESFDSGRVVDPESGIAERAEETMEQFRIREAGPPPEKPTEPTPPVFEYKGIRSTDPESLVARATNSVAKPPNFQNVRSAEEALNLPQIRELFDIGADLLGFTVEDFNRLYATVKRKTATEIYNKLGVRLRGQNASSKPFFAPAWNEYQRALNKYIRDNAIYERDYEEWRSRSGSRAARPSGRGRSRKVVSKEPEYFRGKMSALPFNTLGNYTWAAAMKNQ